MLFHGLGLRLTQPLVLMLMFEFSRSYFANESRDSWSTCKKGQRQSPINIQTDELVFDPNLSLIKLQGADRQLTIAVENIGNDLRLVVISGDITFSGGPLSYSYNLVEFRLKFGSTITGGSDHKLNSVSFPGELQLFAYNSDLYKSFADARDKPNGIAAFSSMLQLSSETNKDLMGIVRAAEATPFLGNKFHLKGIELQTLFPPMDEYMTYEGSLTFSNCAETVTWIVLNRAIHISNRELKTLRQLRTDKTLWSASMADNFRPVNELNNRSVRTNIKFHASDNTCAMKPRFGYFVRQS